ncbi:hypothetical protein M2432_002925 [Mycobacterium sp. OTB74]|nr:hypothetical protein [Mycobacterium sp. OTB74]
MTGTDWPVAIIGSGSIGSEHLTRHYGPSPR